MVLLGLEALTGLPLTTVTQHALLRRAAMKTRLFGTLVLACTFVVPLISGAQDGVRLIGVIPVPGQPIVSSDITWNLLRVLHIDLTP